MVSEKIVQDFQRDLSDIEKSGPRKLYPGSRSQMLLIKLDQVNKKDCRYTTDDIEGSRPKAFKMDTARIGKTNPLVPKYQVPSFVPACPPETTKFIRDAMDVGDIPGAQPSKMKAMNRGGIQENVAQNKNSLMDRYTRNPVPKDNIEGSSTTKMKVLTRIELRR